MSNHINHDCGNENLNQQSQNSMTQSLSDKLYCISTSYKYKTKQNYISKRTKERINEFLEDLTYNLLYNSKNGLFQYYRYVDIDECISLRGRKNIKRAIDEYVKNNNLNCIISYDFTYHGVSEMTIFFDWRKPKILSYIFLFFRFLAHKVTF